MTTTWLKPTLDTKFHIDFSWWDQSGRDFRLHLRDNLCEECRSRFPSHLGTELVDWIDPETAEVKRTDALWQCLQTYCANYPEYINQTLPLTTAVFRAFLANHNQPLSAKELHERIPWKLPETILRTLSGGQAHMGIRPVQAVQKN